MRALLLLLVGGCATTGFATRGDVPVTDGAVVDLMVLWREGERRRDPEMAARALRFERSADRAFLEADLQYLRDRPSGPIRVPPEFHVVGRPAAGGAGDYLVLEPFGREYGATLVTVVRTRRGPKILYRRPEFSEEERATLRPEQLARVAAQRRIAHWRALDAAELTEEVARLRRTLAYQISARAYAEAHDLPLPPYAPDPATVLADLEGRDDAAVRERVVQLLGGAGR